MQTIVIGGGLAGLSAAYFLCTRGEEVVLVEEEKDLGGLAGCYARRYFIENFYHQVMRFNHFVSNLFV